jgi:hypothetical protein
MGEARIGGGMRVASSYLIIYFNRAFSSSIFAIETSSASRVTLWIDDNLESKISLEYQW